MKKFVKILILAMCSAIAVDPSAFGQVNTPVIDKRAAKKILKETDSQFFKTEEASRIGDQLLLWQRNTGGWPKNVNMVTTIS